MERRRISTGFVNLDVALGGWTLLTESGFQSEWGIVRPSVVLLTAEEKSGASTLMQQVAAYVAANNGTPRGVLYVTGDESFESLAARAARIQADHGLVWARHAYTMRGVEAAMDQFGPVMAVIDSVQSMRLPEQEETAPENTVEHRVAVSRIAATLARKHNACIFLVNRGARSKEAGGAHWTGEVSSEELAEVDVGMWMRVEEPQVGRTLVIKVDKNRFSSIK